MKILLAGSDLILEVVALILKNKAVGIFKCSCKDALEYYLDHEPDTIIVFEEWESVDKSTSDISKEAFQDIQNSISSETKVLRITFDKEADLTFPFSPEELLDKIGL